MQEKTHKVSYKLYDMKIMEENGQKDEKNLISAT